MSKNIQFTNQHGETITLLTEAIRRAKFYIVSDNEDAYRSKRVANHRLNNLYSGKFTKKEKMSEEKFNCERQSLIRKCVAGSFDWDYSDPENVMVVMAWQEIPFLTIYYDELWGELHGSSNSSFSSSSKSAVDYFGQTTSSSNSKYNSNSSIDGKIDRVKEIVLAGELAEQVHEYLNKELNVKVFE